MKFSICTTWAKDKKIEDVIEFASNLKLDGIEIWDEHIDDFLKRHNNDMSKLVALLDQSDLKCCAIAPYFDFLLKQNVNQSISCAKKCIKYAKELKCHIIRTFVGDTPSKDIDKEGWLRCILGLKCVTGLADGNNIYFAMETHNNNVTDTPESVKYLLNEVNDSHLKVLFDGFNYTLDGIDLMKSYEELKSETVHYHIKNYIWDKQIGTPLNKGDVDFTELIKILKNEDVFISFEYFCDNLENIISESIKWAKSL